MNDPSRVDAMAQVEDSANDIARIDVVLQEILRQRNIALQRMQTKSESAAQDAETAQTESNEHIEQYTDLGDLQDDFSSLEFEWFPRPECIRPRRMKKVKSHMGPYFVITKVNGDMWEAAGPVNIVRAIVCIDRGLDARDVIR